MELIAYREKHHILDRKLRDIRNSSLPRPQISKCPKKLQQRLARPISCLLHSRMIQNTVDPHLHSGYGMEARFASHMPSITTEGTEEDS
ncbi:hypothetical protein TNCV_123701 [Trichonephila clavipes]|nr:hypothetical protein TNCV_123701 [Trichonephila clavipes]